MIRKIKSTKSTKSTNSTVRSDGKYASKKNIKVGCSSTFRKGGYVDVPKLHVEGRWLEEIGFSIGEQIVVEYGEGCVTFRKPDDKEMAALEEKKLKAEIREREEAILSLQRSIEDRQFDIQKVAENSNRYIEDR